MAGLVPVAKVVGNNVQKRVDCRIVQIVEVHRVHEFTECTWSWKEFTKRVDCTNREFRTKRKHFK